MMNNKIRGMLDDWHRIGKNYFAGQEDINNRMKCDHAIRLVYNMAIESSDPDSFCALESALERISDIRDLSDEFLEDGAPNAEQKNEDKETIKHISDCGVNNEPAFRNVNCDCKAVQLMDKIDAYPFESIGGDLKNCLDWIELGKEVRDLRHRLFDATISEEQTNEQG